MESRAARIEECRSTEATCHLWVRAFSPSVATPFIIAHFVGVRTVTDHIQIDGRSYLNLSSFNFLGMNGSKQMEIACRETIDRYGVGSCGPRGFYGSFDVHIHLEEAIADFVGNDEAILYSDSVACLASVIPAYCKRSDLIV